MIKNIFRFLLNGMVVLFFLVISGCQKTQDPTRSKDQKPFAFENMVVFGNSYSDNGNVYRLTKGYYPGEAYFKGRFSNGPVWAEYFAQSIQINPNDPSRFLDFAYGQAQILAPYTIEIEKDGEKLPYSIPDLNEQITSYLQKQVKHPEKTLFVVFIGTNDLLNLADSENHQKLLCTGQKINSCRATP